MSERMVKLKNESDIPDLGVGVSLQVVNGNIEAIVIKSLSDDTYIRIAKTDSYSTTLSILKPQGKTEKKIHVVKGKLLGLVDYREEFHEGDDYKRSEAANAHLRAIKEDKNIWDDSLGLEVVEESVYVFEDKIN